MSKRETPEAMLERLSLNVCPHFTRGESMARCWHCLGDAIAQRDRERDDEARLQISDAFQRGLVAGNSLLARETERTVAAASAVAEYGRQRDDEIRAAIERRRETYLHGRDPHHGPLDTLDALARELLGGREDG